MGTMLASGEDCGIVGFGSQSKSDYVIESQRGSYYPMNEFLDTFAADTKALFPDGVWEGMKGQRQHLRHPPPRRTTATSSP